MFLMFVAQVASAGGQGNTQSHAFKVQQCFIIVLGKFALSAGTL
jgi:hypothetical protein